MARKPQAVLKAEYKTARRNLLQNVRRLKKRGYDVSDIKIPAIPKGNIKQADIREITNLDKTRYEKATKIELVKHRDKHGKITDVLERVSGTKAKYLEKVRAGRKTSATLKEKYKARKQHKEYQRKQEKPASEPLKRYADPQDYYGQSTEDDLAGILWDDGTPMDPSDWGGDVSDPDRNAKPFYSDELGVYDPVEGKFVDESEEPDFEEYAYYMDTETGEVIERNWGANKPKIEGRNFVRILPESAQGEIIYRNAIAELEIMESYSGNPKHGKNTKHDSIVRQNATSIKEALQNAYEKNPSAVQNAILHTNPDQDFHSVQYMYRAGAYGAYITRFGFILDQLDMNVDYESEEDYDEGNFEY